MRNFPSNTSASLIQRILSWRSQVQLSAVFLLKKGRQLHQRKFKKKPLLEKLVNMLHFEKESTDSQFLSKAVLWYSIFEMCRKEMLSLNSLHTLFGYLYCMTWFWKI